MLVARARDYILTGRRLGATDDELTAALHAAFDYAAPSTETGENAQPTPVG